MGHFYTAKKKRGLPGGGGAILLGGYGIVLITQFWGYWKMAFPEELYDLALSEKLYVALRTNV